MNAPVAEVNAGRLTVAQDKVRAAMVSVVRRTSVPGVEANAAPLIVVPVKEPMAMANVVRRMSVPEVAESAVLLIVVPAVNHGKTAIGVCRTNCAT